MRPRFQPSRPVEQAIGAERRTSEKRELCDAGHRQEADPRAGLAACSPSGGPSRGRTCSHGRASHPRRLAIRRRRSSTPASSLVPSGGGPARLHPTEAQRNEWDGARGRALDVRTALIERHRDVLPDSPAPASRTGTSTTPSVGDRRTRSRRTSMCSDEPRWISSTVATPAGWRRSRQRSAISGSPRRRSKNCAHGHKPGLPKRRPHDESGRRFPRPLPVAHC
jgi:hypothetical protein